MFSRTFAVSLIAALSCLTSPIAEAADADLAAVAEALDADAVRARTLRADASARYVGISGRPNDWIVRNRTFVTALGKIVRSSGEVVRKGDALAAFIRSSEPRQKVQQDGLDEALARYRGIAIEVDSAASIIRDRLSEASLPLPDLGGAADRYADDADRLLAAIEDMHEILVLQLRGSNDLPMLRDIRFHLYQLLDSQPDDAYGLYTHVLFMDGNPRNRAFFKALRAQTPEVDGLSDGQAALINLFAIPVKDRIEARMEEDSEDGITDPSIYDYDGASKLLLKVCLSDEIRPPDVCRSRFGSGPFLLAHKHWLFGDQAVTAPLLLVDLSDVHENAFGEFIGAVKEQVMSPDFSGDERITTLRLQLLTIILDAADWLDPIKTSVAEIVSLGGKK